MGIYPNVDYRMEYPSGRRGEAILVRTETEPGKTTVQRFRLVSVEVSRTDCYCCSCPEESYGGDPACRNHGYAAKRPCVLHGMPGETWDPDMDPERAGVMPDSVQAERARLTGTQTP